MSKFLRWIVNIVLVVAIVVTCGLLIPPLAGITTVIIDDVDMPTNLSKGSVTYGTPKKIEELVAGDDVIVQDAQGDYVYRLRAVDVTSGQCELEDIKSTDNQMRTAIFTKDISKVLFTLPFIGYITMAMKSTEGLIIIGLVVVFIIILFILSELWKKDEDEDDEDEEDEEEQDVAPQVDMSAHILEKVSSEIGSEISSVIASDADKGGVAEGIGVVGGSAMGDTQPLAVPAGDGESSISQEEKEAAKKDRKEKREEKKKEKQEKKAERAKAKEATDENQDAVVAKTDDDMKEVEADMAEDKIEEATKTEVAQEVLQEVPADLEPVEMAIPEYTAEELIQKAKEAGEEPEVEEDENLGITILDYSKIL